MNIKASRTIEQTTEQIGRIYILSDYLLHRSERKTETYYKLRTMERIDGRLRKCKRFMGEFAMRIAECCYAEPSPKQSVSFMSAVLAL